MSLLFQTFYAGSWGLILSIRKFTESKITQPLYQFLCSDPLMIYRELIDQSVQRDLESSTLFESKINYVDLMVNLKLHLLFLLQIDILM